MIKKLLISGTSLVNSLLLILMLLLGAQNLSQKHSVRLGLHQSKDFPTGFLVGISVALGSISGGLSTVIFMKSQKNNFE